MSQLRLPAKLQETIMKQFITATVLMLAAITLAWAQALTTGDPHHPTSTPASRIAFLRAKLKITDAQIGAWNAFGDALRVNAKWLGEVRAAMMSG
jgi:hypothetical protein